MVAWFNGYNVDQRGDPDTFGIDNAFPSDEDEPGEAGQDYGSDRRIEGCVPFYEDLDEGMKWVGIPTDFAVVTGFFEHHVAAGNGTIERGSFAVAVEQGDCDPRNGRDFRYRGHLDFTDPNWVYHEVQEYEYVCGGTTAFGGPKNVLPGLDGDGAPAVADLVRDLFPNTGTDAMNQDGCEFYELPTDSGDPMAGDLGHFDFGHKCNGTWRDLFTERMWMTEVHVSVLDFTTYQEYTFALQIDTCSGFNGREGMPIPGLAGPGEPTTGPGQGGLGPSEDAHEPYPGYSTLYESWFDLELHGFFGGYPLPDVCTDGSSFSFDDTARDVAKHWGPPGGLGDTDGMRGNSYDFGWSSPTFAKHRTNCRVNALEWPYNESPPGPPEVTDDCYAEDHRSAGVDIYVLNEDPTGDLWFVNTNGLTGLGSYLGPGPSTSHEYDPSSGGWF